jgi:hypothetical protein
MIIFLIKVPQCSVYLLLMSMTEITNHIPRMQKASQDLTLIIDPGDN